MRTMHVLIAGLAVSTLSLAALAQPPAPAPTPKPADKAPPAPRPPADAGRPGQGGGQGGGGGGQLSAEKSKAAWELEANGVAKRLGLKDEVAKSLVKAYTDARTSQNEGFVKMREEQRKARQEGGGGGGGGGQAEMRTALETLNKKEKEKFEKALPAGLSPDQKTKVMASLGSFNIQWDRMADAIAGFKLEPAKQQAALDAIEDHVLAIAKLNAAAAGGGGENADREAQREGRAEARTKLTDSLKKVLSEEQMKKFDESTRPGGRNPGGGGGGRPGGGGGGGGN